MLSFKKLSEDHSQDLLAFELENRTYFESMITERAAEFYSSIGINLHIKDLIEKSRNQSALAMLAFEGGEIVARANVHRIDCAQSSCEIGYRVAQRHTGKGIATACIHKLKQLATEHYQINNIIARVLDNNPASKKALLKCGFRHTGETDHSVTVLNTMYICHKYIFKKM